MEDVIQLYGAVAGILGLIIAILALLRDVFDFRLQWSVSKNRLKNLFVNQRVLTVISLILLTSSTYNIFLRKPVISESPITPPALEPTRDEPLLVLVAPFDGQEDLRADARIEDRLRDDLVSLANLAEISIKRLPAPIKEANKASDIEEIRSRFNPSILIWGWYDQIGITTRVETFISGSTFMDTYRPEIPEFLRFDTSTDSISFYVTQQLPSQISHITFFTLSKVYQTKRDYRRAADALRTSLNNLPNNVSDFDMYNLYRDLAYLQYINKEPSACIETITLVISNSEFAGDHHLRAQCHEMNSLLKYALENSVDLSVDFTQFGATQSMALMSDKYIPQTAFRSSEALSDYNYIFEHHSDEPGIEWVYLYRGKQYYLQGERSQAFHDFNALISRSKSSSSAIFYIGYFLVTLEEYSESFEYLAKISLCNKEEPLLRSDLRDLYQRIAQEQYERKKYDLSIKAYTNAIQCAPTDADTHIKRADAFLSTAQFEQALADQSAAIKLLPENGYYYYLRAKTKRLMKRNWEAMDDLLLALDYLHYDENQSDEKVNNELFEVYREMGYIYYDEDQFFHAVKSFSLAIDIFPMHSEIYRHRGDAFAAAKHFDSAIRDFSRAIELDAANPNPYFSRGMAYFAIKDYISAQSDLEKYLSISKNEVFRTRAENVLDEIRAVKRRSLLSQP